MLPGFCLSENPDDFNILFIKLHRIEVIGVNDYAVPAVAVFLAGEKAGDISAEHAPVAADNVDIFVIVMGKIHFQRILSLIYAAAQHVAGHHAIGNVDFVYFGGFGGGFKLIAGFRISYVRGNKFR